MNCLLDTHAFLWAAFDPRQLSRTAAQAIQAPENDVFVSAVSFWEVFLKHGLGKIELKGVAPEDLPGVARRSGFEVLSLEADEAASSGWLPREAHKDPFDRALVHQAICRHLTLVSVDADLDVYLPRGLRRLW